MDVEEHPTNGEFSSKEAIQRRLSRCEKLLSQQDGQLSETVNVPDLWQQRSYLLARLERYSEAIDSYRQTVVLLPKDAKVWCNYGSALAAKGYLQEAVDAYDRALELQPEYVNVWRRRGKILYRLGEYAAAIDSYNQALIHHPEESRLWHGKGLATLRLNCPEQAVDCFRAAINYAPDVLDSYLAQAYALIDLERFEDAFALVQPLIAKGWVHPYLFDCYAYLLDQRGESDIALQYLEDAAYLRPSKASFWFHKGMILTRLRRYPEAHDAFREAIRRQADHADSWLALGLILRELSEPEAAIAAFDKALTLSPSHPLAFFHQACCYALLGKRDRAAENLDQAISLDAETYLAKAQREAILSAL